MKTAISHFNSHPHEEDDRIRLCFHNVELYFNSHPHEEDDIIQDFPAPSGNISTHILTKRMTKSLRIYRGGLFISTHILTKRMTAKEWSKCLHSKFQLTSSRRGWLLCIEGVLVTARFQLTSSRRGWRAWSFHRFPILSFQLTSSRRGWRLCEACYRFSCYFNSHPHEEDDGSQPRWWELRMAISTHILTKRMTNHLKNPFL